MKRIFIVIAAFNFALISSCSSKKQQGEEYYDPNYKAQTSQSASSQTAAATETVPGSAATATPPATATTQTEAAPTTTETPTTAATPAAPAAGTTPTEKAAGKQLPATKDEATVTTVAKDKLKESPAKGNFDTGKNLIAKSDCLSCHKDDVKLLGPAYVDVAKKYPESAKNIDFLATKIIKGGAGNWGDIPMSPHADLPKADAQEMVKYILSLNN
jgi:cytochrome c